MDVISDMSRHMRTTVRLDDALLERAKREAGRRGETLTSLIERGLRLVLANPEKRQRGRRVEIPVCREGGGTLPGVDLDDSAALLDIVEGRR
jgi:Arc/MetJ family transcription regulator